MTTTGFAVLVFFISAFLFYAFSQIKANSEHMLLAFFFLTLHFVTMNIVASVGLTASHCDVQRVNETSVTANTTEYAYDRVCSDNQPLTAGNQASNTAEAFYTALIYYARLGFTYCFFYMVWRVLGYWGKLPKALQMRHDGRY